ncbi:hypothetical protein D9M72_464670 [compost metagenome]
MNEAALAGFAAVKDLHFAAEIARNFAVVRLGDEGADAVVRIQRIAHVPVLHLGDDLFQQLFLDGGMDDQSRDGRAILAHVPIGAVHDMSGDRVQIVSVVHDDRGVLAAHFEDDFLEVGLGRILEEASTGLRRTCEGHGVDIHVPADRFADL